MRKAARAGKVISVWTLALVSLHALLAQSIVFVSPSNKGVLSMACAAGSLDSFEELHYLATARYLATRLCPSADIEGGVGLWKGQAENSGYLDGCSKDEARQLGALLARYYHQKAALVFDRDPAGKSWLIRFTTRQSIRVIGARMAQAKVTGATVIPGPKDNAVWMVAASPQQRSQAELLYALLHAHHLEEQPGAPQLIGDEDRAKAQAAYNRILAQAPPGVRQLGRQMYSESFADLGLEPPPAP